MGDNIDDMLQVLNESISSMMTSYRAKDSKIFSDSLEKYEKDLDNILNTESVLEKLKTRFVIQQRLNGNCFKIKKLLMRKIRDISTTDANDKDKVSKILNVHSLVLKIILTEDEKNIVDEIVNFN